MPPLLLAFALPAAWAAHRDLEELYVVAPPPWMLVGGQYYGQRAPWWRRFVYVLRLRHSLLSVLHVVPGFTVLTRLQQVTILYATVTVTLISAVTFRARSRIRGSKPRQQQRSAHLTLVPPPWAGHNATGRRIS